MKVIRNSLLALSLGLVAAGGAVAGGWDHPSRGHGGDRGDHGRGPPPGRGYSRGGFDGRGFDGPPPAMPIGRPDFRNYEPGYGPAPRGGGWRRGDFLPRGFGDGPELDPRHYRLRTPPPGYVWRGSGRDAYLVQRSTGLILDTVPGAW